MPHSARRAHRACHPWLWGSVAWLLLVTPGLAATRAHHHLVTGPQRPIRTISADGEQVDAATAPPPPLMAIAAPATPAAPVLEAPVAPGSMDDAIASLPAQIPAPAGAMPPLPAAAALIDATGRIHAQPMQAGRAMQPYGASLVRARTLAAARLVLTLPPAAIASAIERASKVYGVDPALVRAVIQTESGFHQGARSNKGAQGLMQLMPATAARFGVYNAYDPEQNIHGGVAYLAWLLQRYAGNTSLAVAGYNAGEGAVDRWGGIPPYLETQRYVGKVQSLYQQARYYPTGTAAAITSTWRVIDASGDHALN